MKLVISSKNGKVSVPSELLSYIDRATKTDISVFLAIASLGTPISVSADAERIASLSGTSRDDVIMSAAFWRGTGLLTETEDTAEAAKTAPTEKNEPSKKPAPRFEMPSLSAADIAAITKNSPEKLEIINTCQGIVGKMFNTSECAVILGLKEYLGVDDEYIAIVTAYCVKKGKRSVKYIEKTAIDLYDRDIDSTAALEEHICRLEKKDTLEARLRSLIGAGARAFTPKEKACIERWSSEFPFEFDVIEHAYGKTVGAIGKPSIPYMDKILLSWHEKGHKTLSEIENGEIPPEISTGGSFDTDDFFRMAVKRGLDVGNTESK